MAPNMTPDADRVTVWTMQVDAPSSAVLARWRAVLSSDELSCAERYHSDIDRHAYIAAHALLRGLLETVGRRPAASWEFRAEETGKPQIIAPAQGTTLQFSLSHARGFVACGVARGFALGIDAESRDRRPTEKDVVQAILAPAEVALLNDAPDELRHEKFLCLWTLREAYVKATGTGIRLPREDFWFALEPLGIRFEDGTGDASQWQFFMWSEARHLLALAVNRDQPVNLVNRMLTQDELR